MTMLEMAQNREIDKRMSLKPQLYSARHGVSSLHVTHPGGHARHTYSMEYVVEPCR